MGSKELNKPEWLHSYKFWIKWHWKRTKHVWYFMAGAALMLAAWRSSL